MYFGRFPDRRHQASYRVTTKYTPLSSSTITSFDMDSPNDYSKGYEQLTVVDDPNATLLEDEAYSPRLLTQKEERISRLQFYSLCWSLFLIGWNDGSTGPLLPRIHEVYKVCKLTVSPLANVTVTFLFTRLDLKRSLGYSCCLSRWE